MAVRSEIERNKAVAHAFYQAGVDGRLTGFAPCLDPRISPSRAKPFDLDPRTP